MSFFDYLANNYEALTEFAIEHVQLVLVAIVGAAVVGVSLGIVAHRIPLLRAPSMTTVSTFLTIPSLALIALLLAFTGIGATPAIIALLYALLPITSNTLSGLQSVDPAVVESARGIGMGATRRLLRIELPLAWPVIITGLRVPT